MCGNPFLLSIDKSGGSVCFALRRTCFASRRKARAHSTHPVFRTLGSHSAHTPGLSELGSILRSPAGSCEPICVVWKASCFDNHEAGSTHRHWPRPERPSPFSFQHTRLQGAQHVATTDGWDLQRRSAHRELFSCEKKRFQQSRTLTEKRRSSGRVPPRQDRSIATQIEQALVHIAGVKVVADNFGEGHLLYFHGRAMRTRSEMSKLEPRTRSSRMRKTLASCAPPCMLSYQGVQTGIRHFTTAQPTEESKVDHLPSRDGRARGTDVARSCLSE